LHELIASSRVKDVKRVSTDGSHWVPIEQVPYLARIVLAAAESQGEPYQKVKAVEIRSRLRSLRGLGPADVFRLPRTATLEDYRATFFRLVKPFHPDKLPSNTLPELRDACSEMFSFLSTLMVEAEREVRTRSSPGLRAPGVDRTPTPSHGHPAAKVPSYGPEQFVGIERGPNGVRATVRINPKNVGIFTDHSLTNISTEGVFLPTSSRLPLGSLVDVRFIFENSPRQIRARARVVWENMGASCKGSPGYGVRFVRLEKADQAFIRSFIAHSAAQLAQSSH
jgi:uncharacterized protein (TIGR02266 family)